MCYTARVTKLRKIISGGQTGVDQAAFRAAEASGLEIGGWCPPDAMSHDGPIPERFLKYMKRTPAFTSSNEPNIPRSQRTNWNVRDSDAILVLRKFVPVAEAWRNPGTSYTFECAVLYGRPLLLCDPDDPDRTKAHLVREWLRTENVETLNVAGPAEHTQLGIGQLAEQFLLEVFRPQAQSQS